MLRIGAFIVFLGITITAFGFGVSTWLTKNNALEILQQLQRTVLLIGPQIKKDPSFFEVQTFTIKDRYQTTCNLIQGSTFFDCTVKNLTPALCREIQKINWLPQTTLIPLDCTYATEMTFTFSPNLDGKGETCQTDEDCADCGVCIPQGICADKCVKDGTICAIDRIHNTPSYQKNGNYAKICCVRDHVLEGFCYQRLQFDNEKRQDLGCSVDTDKCCLPSEFFGKDGCYPCSDAEPRLDSSLHSEQIGHPAGFCSNRVRAGHYSYLENCPDPLQKRSPEGICQCPPEKPLMDEKGLCYSCGEAPHTAVIEYGEPNIIQVAASCNRYYQEPYVYKCPPQTVSIQNTCVDCNLVTPDQLKSQYQCNACPLTQWEGRNYINGICRCQDGYTLVGNRCIQQQKTIEAN